MEQNLAQMVVLIQEQLQKSTEYAEHMSTIGRDSGQSDLRIAISEAEVELPLAFKVNEVGVSKDDMQKLITKGDSIDIADKLLSLPKLGKSFEFALKDRMTLDHAVKIGAEELAAMPIAAATVTPRDEERTLPQMMDEIHAERIKGLKWDTIEKQKFMELKVATVQPSAKNDEKPEQFFGKISLKFKVTSA